MTTKTQHAAPPPGFVMEPGVTYRTDWTPWRRVPWSPADDQLLVKDGERVTNETFGGRWITGWKRAEGGLIFFLARAV